MSSVKICWREKMQMLMQKRRITVTVPSSFSPVLDKWHLWIFLSNFAIQISSEQTHIIFVQSCVWKAVEASFSSVSVELICSKDRKMLLQRWIFISHNRLASVWISVITADTDCLFVFHVGTLCVDLANKFLFSVWWLQLMKHQSCLSILLKNFSSREDKWEIDVYKIVGNSKLMFINCRKLLLL